MAILSDKHVSPRVIGLPGGWGHHTLTSAKCAQVQQFLEEPKMTDENEKKSPIDPFDPAALRLDQSFAEAVGVKKLLTTVPVRKPNRQDWFRVHPDPSYRLTPAAIIEMKEDRETYLVVPGIAAELPGEFSVATLYTALNRKGVLHLWPVKLPGPDGKHNEWHRSAAEAAERGMNQWGRMTANMSLGAYEIFEPIGDISAPDWPDISFEEILKVAFRDRIVDSMDHPLINQLRGAA
jgi:hypothetical protein